VPGDSTAYAGAVDYRIRKLAAHVRIRGNWLDCGCAEGFYAVALREAGADKVVGCDIIPERIAWARQHWASVAGVSFVVAAAEAMPFEDQAVDGILMNEVLEHVGHQRQSLGEAHRILKVGARLAVFSPNRWFPFEGHGATFGPVRLNFPVPFLPWLPKRLGLQFMNARNYWPRELATLVSSAGFHVDEIDFALPLFGRYRWLPDPLVQGYLKALPRLDRNPLIRRFGVSTLVVAHKPGSA
jgi:ubiquinone/menaquinone biosynthesis C-methylase UbiE